MLRYADGIMKMSHHGYAYPSATLNAPGNTNGNDWCMSVGVTAQTMSGHDTPQNDNDWPNSNYGGGAYLMVWLK